MVVPIRGGLEAHSPRPGEYLERVGDRDKFLATLEPNDVVSVPLFVGGVEEPGPFPPEPLPDYEAHLAFLREVAPRVMGIITGNHGPELSYKHVGWVDKWNVRRMAAFVEQTAPLIVDAGARPFYGTIDWDLLHDVYGPLDYMLQKTINRYNGVQVVFVGFTLCPGCYMQPDVKHFEGAQVQLIQQHDPTSARFRQYLAQGECWSGIGGRLGLEAGNAEKLETLGFKGGIVGL
jgi:hypothetical protein